MYWILKGWSSRWGVHITGEVQDGILGHRNKMKQVLFRFIFYLEKKRLQIFNIQIDSYTPV